MSDRSALPASPSEPAWRRIAWWAIAPALVVIAGSMGTSHERGVAPALLAAALSGIAAMAALIAPIRPRTAVLLNGAAIGAYFGFGLDNGPIFLSVPLVVVLASQRARPRVLLTALVPALLLVLAGLSVRSLLHDASVTVSFWQGFGTVALALSAGMLGWWTTERRAVRLQQAQRAAAEERLRMAQDLHDGVGHGLAVISMHAAVALHVLDKLAPLSPAPAEGPEAQLRQSVTVIRDTGRESLDALRVQLAAMSTGPATGPRRPAPGVPELPDLLARVRTGGLAVVLQGSAGDVPSPVGETVYAVVQEALTNVLRHARASRAVVTLSRVDDGLVVSIEDDGPSSSPGTPGMGISGMRARVSRLGGTLEAGPSSGGFLVRAHLPVSS